MSQPPTGRSPYALTAPVPLDTKALAARRAFADETGGEAEDSDRAGVTARIPLWQRISDDMRAAIQSGQIKPGQRLPSETQLRERYNASVRPVRQAMEDLRNSGLVVTEQGRGTIVRKQDSRTLAFNPFIRRTPGAVRFTVWDSTWRTTHRQLLHGKAARHAAALEGNPSEPVFVLERHLLDPTGRDLVIHRVIQRFTTIDELNADDNYDGWEPAQLYAQLTEAGYTLAWTDLITIAHATNDDINLMTMPRGVPVLLHTRTIRAADGHPLAVEETRLPGHRAAIISSPLQ